MEKLDISPVVRWERLQALSYLIELLADTKDINNYFQAVCFW
jgi:hypothetical protein